MYRSNRSQNERKYVEKMCFSRRLINSIDWRVKSIKVKGARIENTKKMAFNLIKNNWIKLNTINDILLHKEDKIYVANTKWLGPTRLEDDDRGNFCSRLQIVGKNKAS